jgi:hypothetical protein
MQWMVPPRQLHGQHHRLDAQAAILLNSGSNRSDESSILDNLLSI